MDHKQKSAFYKVFQLPNYLEACIKELESELYEGADSWDDMDQSDKEDFEEMGITRDVFIHEAEKRKEKLKQDQ